MQSFRRLALFLSLISVCFAQHMNRKCADTRIPTTDGKTIHIPDYKGKVVLVASFLTTCGDCLTTLQFLGRLQKEFGPRGFQVVAISLDEDQSKVKPFADRYQFPFPVGHLAPAPAIKLMDLHADAHPIVPYIFFVDWMGNVRFQYAGNDPMFAQGEKGIHGIVYGLVRQKEEKKGPEYQTRPAGKQ